MFARPRVLSLIVTHRCTAACDHCCFGCSPRAEAAIPLPRLRTLIDEAAALPSLAMVAFTGGECFLLGRELDALIARAHAHGLRTRAISNGYWATSAENARRRLSALRAAGLDELHLSTGDFHARDVPVERVVHAARAALERGLRASVWIEECRQSSFDEAAVRVPLAEAIAAGRLLVESQPWIPDAEGRGTTRLSHAAERSRFAGARAGCATILDVLSVTPAQQLVACCGFPLESLPDLHLGSVAQRSIGDVLAAAPDDVLKYWIHVAGPEAILDFVAARAPGYRLPVECVSVCQTCTHLYRDPTAQRVLVEHAAEIPVREILTAFAGSASARSASARTVPRQ